MQFTHQVISLFISGFIALIWMLLPVYKQLIETETVETMIYMFISNPFGILLIIPWAYSIGSAINSIANELFGNIDKEIRKKIFINLPDFSGNDSEIADTYHNYRYHAYQDFNNAYDFLSFHREIIRILRASSMNFFLIAISMVTLTSCLLCKFFAFILLVIFIINLIFFHKKPKIDFFKFLFYDICYIKFLIFFYYYFSITKILAILSYYPYYLFYLGNLSLLLSCICYSAWEKQQKDFYNSIIRMNSYINSTQKITS